MLERCDIWIFVSQANVDRRVFPFFKGSIQPEPRPPAARTKVQDPVRSGILKRSPEARSDGFVEIRKV